MPVIEAVPTKNSRRATINKFKLNVQTNAACVDILVWAAREETGEAKLLCAFQGRNDRNRRGNLKVLNSVAKGFTFSEEDEASQNYHRQDKYPRKLC